MASGELAQGAWRSSARPARIARAKQGRKWPKPEGFAVPPPGGVRTESRGEVNGIFVINSKFKIQFCKLNLSPSRWTQMKNICISFLFSFLRSKTFILGTFSFGKWFVSYFNDSKAP